MRHSVATLSYRFRKTLDNVLYSLNRSHVTAKDVVASLARVPFSNAAHGWLPLYTMVTFRPDVSYSAVRRKAERQSQLLNLAAWLSATGTVLAAGLASAVALRRLYGGGLRA